DFPLAHFKHDRVRVADRQKSRYRGVPRHTVPPRIVHHDQIGTAPLGELCGDTDTRPGGDDRPTCGYLGANPFDDLRASELHPQLTFPFAPGSLRDEKEWQSMPSTHAKACYE